MKIDKTSIIFIIGFITVIILAFVSYRLLEVKIPLIDRLFKGDNPVIKFEIIYSEGSNIKIRYKNRDYEELRPDTFIINQTEIVTGPDSTLIIFSEGHGYYTIYPDSMVFFDNIESFDESREKKETTISLEKGALSVDIKFYSRNSRLIVNTFEAVVFSYGGSFTVFKNTPLTTGIYSIEGELNYRPFSTRFNVLRDKKSFDITRSIERLIDQSNSLKSGEYFIINMDHRERLDQLIKQIYESDTSITLNSEYINRTLHNEHAKGLPVEMPALSEAASILGNPASLIRTEFTIPDDDANYFFRNAKLDKDKKYIICLSPGYHNIMQEYPAFTINNFFSISDSIAIKTIPLRRYSGVQSIIVNNKEIPFTQDLFAPGNKITYIIEKTAIDPSTIINILSDVDITSLEIIGMGNTPVMDYQCLEPEKNLLFRFRTDNNESVDDRLAFRIEFIDQTIER